MRTFLLYLPAAILAAGCGPPPDPSHLKEAIASADAVVLRSRQGDRAAVVRVEDREALARLASLLVFEGEPRYHRGGEPATVTFIYVAVYRGEDHEDLFRVVGSETIQYGPDGRYLVKLVDRAFAIEALRLSRIDVLGGG